MATLTQDIETTSFFNKVQRSLRTALDLLIAARGIDRDLLALSNASDETLARHGFTRADLARQIAAKHLDF